MKKLRDLLMNRGQGFGLIEVLISLALAGVLAFVLASISVNMVKSMSSMRKTTEALSSYGGVMVLLQGNPAACAAGLTSPMVGAAWAGTPGTAINLNSISLGTELLFQKDTPINQLVARGLTLEKTAGPWPFLMLMPAPALPKTYTKYLAMLTVNLEKQSQPGQVNMGGDALKKKKFYLTATADETGKLVECYGGDSLNFLQDLCVRQLGGKYDETQYPACLLTQFGMADSYVNRASGFSTPPVTTDPRLFVRGVEQSALVNTFNSIAKFDGHTTGLGSGDVINMDSTGQSRLLMSGGGDTAPNGLRATYASLSMKRVGPLGEHWFMAYKGAAEVVSGMPAESLAVGKYSSGTMEYFLTINPGGAVGIGTNATNPSGAGVDFLVGGKTRFMSDVNFDNPVVVSGTLAVKGNVNVSGTVTASSDERLKKDFAPLADSLQRLLKIKGYSYFWKDPQADTAKMLGVKAQEVEKSFPELVVTDAKGFKSVAYANFIAPMIEAIRELHVKIMELFKGLKESEEKLNQLQKENKELQKIVCELRPNSAFCDRKKQK